MDRFRNLYIIIRPAWDLRLGGGRTEAEATEVTQWRREIDGEASEAR